MAPITSLQPPAAPFSVQSTDAEGMLENKTVVWRDKYTVTSLVVPAPTGWSGLTVMDAIAKIAIEIFRTICLFTLVLPVIAFTVDIIGNAFATKTSDVAAPIVAPIPEISPIQIEDAEETESSVGQGEPVALVEDEPVEGASPPSAEDNPIDGAAPSSATGESAVSLCENPLLGRSVSTKGLRNLQKQVDVAQKNAVRQAANLKRTQDLQVIATQNLETAQEAKVVSDNLVLELEGKLQIANESVDTAEIALKEAETGLKEAKLKVKDEAKALSRAQNQQKVNDKALVQSELSLEKANEKVEKAETAAASAKRKYTESKNLAEAKQNGLDEAAREIRDSTCTEAVIVEEPNVEVPVEDLKEEVPGIVVEETSDDVVQEVSGIVVEETA